MTVDERLTQHDEQIKTLFERQKDLHALTESVNKIALSVERLTVKMSGHDERLANIENDTRYKARTVWSCVVSGFLGAAVAALAAILFGG